MRLLNFEPLGDIHSLLAKLGKLLPFRKSYSTFLSLNSKDKGIKFEKINKRINVKMEV